MNYRLNIGIVGARVPCINDEMTSNVVSKNRMLYM